MKEQILHLCKRLNCFTLDKLELITEQNMSEIMPILSELISENLISENNGQYFYNKKEPATQNYSVFRYYKKEIIDLVIRCFCSSIPTYKVSEILQIGERQTVKFYDIFRALIYERQYNQLIKNFNKKGKIGRSRNILDSEMFFYIYDNQVFIAPKLLNSDVMKNFNSKEIKEFKKIACYIKRSMESHNKNKKNLEHKIAESLWRREKSFDFLCADLKKLLNIT